MHEFLREGAQAVAYTSIVASGPNACVLHYRENNRQMNDGDLLLIDAGCEYQGYASDITRTFPVNGRFTGPQKAVYELVLAAQLACIDAVKPGAPFHDYHHAAERVLAQGFIDLGLCSGTLDGVLESGSYASSTCTAPATGSGWTCTTPACTSRTAHRCGSRPAWC